MLSELCISFWWLYDVTNKINSSENKTMLENEPFVSLKRYGLIEYSRRFRNSGVCIAVIMTINGR